MANRALTRTLAFTILIAPAPLAAQTIELAPFVGYRVGDLESSQSLGMAVDVPIAGGMQVEGIFSHQSHGPYSAVDHWQGGALQEYGDGPVRPFLSGLVGITRYAIQADNEIRFSVAAGGGVKVFPTPRVGVRLEARVFSTVLDAETTSGVCGGRGCLVGLHLDVAWQLEVTAGVVVRLGPERPRLAQ